MQKIKICWIVYCEDSVIGFVGIGLDLYWIEIDDKFWELSASLSVIQSWYIFYYLGLPIVQNRQILRTFQSLGSTYQDMFVYFIFYTVVIISFSLIGSQMI